MKDMGTVKHEFCTWDCYYYSWSSDFFIKIKRLISFLSVLRMKKLGKTHDILVVVYSIVEFTVEIKYSDLWPRMWTTKCVSLSQMQSTIMFYSLFCVLVQYWFPLPSSSRKIITSIIVNYTVNGGGHGNPLQYSCLEDPMDRGDWWVQSMGLRGVGHDWSDLTHTHRVKAHVFPESPCLPTHSVFITISG